MADDTTAALKPGDTQQADTTATTTADTATTAAAATTQTADTAKPVWPDDWRKQMAGEDEKELKLAERYATPKDIWKKARELERLFSSRDTKAALPDNPTPEQLTAYRLERGIPEKPEGYLEKLPEGLVIGEKDKPLFESFVKGLHELNADPKFAHYAVKWYNNLQEESAAKAAEQDTGHKTEVEDALRTEWGPDYRANVNHVKAFLDGAPDGVGELIGNARDSEGRALLNNPNVLKWLVGTARELNPTHTIVPGTGGNQVQSIEEEIGKIEKTMRTHRAEYNRDEGMQKRLRDLYTARAKVKSRAA